MGAITQDGEGSLLHRRSVLATRRCSAERTLCFLSQGHPSSLPPCFPRSFSPWCPRMVSPGDSHPGAGVGLDFPNLLCVSGLWTPWEGTSTTELLAAKLSVSEPHCPEHRFPGRDSIVFHHGHGQRPRRPLAGLLILRVLRPRHCAGSALHPAAPHPAPGLPGSERGGAGRGQVLSSYVSRSGRAGLVSL